MLGPCKLAIGLRKCLNNAITRSTAIGEMIYADCINWLKLDVAIEMLIVDYTPGTQILDSSRSQQCKKSNANHCSLSLPCLVFQLLGSDCNLIKRKMAMGL